MCCILGLESFHFGRCQCVLHTSSGTCGSCGGGSRQTRPCPNGCEMLHNLRNYDQKDGCTDYHPPLASSIGCPSFFPRNIVFHCRSYPCQLGQGRGKVEGSFTTRYGECSTQHSHLLVCGLHFDETFLVEYMQVVLAPVPSVRRSRHVISSVLLCTVYSLCV